MFSESTKSQIQKELDRLEIVYSKKATKSELIKLLEDEQKPEKKEKKKEKQVYFDGVLVTKTRQVKDKEKNPMVKVSLIDGTVNKVPESEYENHITYK